MNKLVLNIELDLDKTTKNGMEFIIDPRAEQSILELLAFRDKIDNALHLISDNLKTEMIKLGDNTCQVHGDQIQAKLTGAKYSAVGKVEPRFIKETAIKSVRRTIKTKDVDAYFLKNKELPKGIINKEQKMKIVVKGDD